MNQQRKNTIIALVEQLLPMLLAVVCVLVMTVSTHQAFMAIPLRLNFEGQYSFDGGENWQELTAASDLSADQGDLLLRGHFDEEISPGGILYLYRDHFGITIKINGEIHYLSTQSEILMLGEAGRKYLADTCGREWTQVGFENGLPNTDTVEIHLQKMHDYIDPHAYRNFLNSCYVGPIDTTIMESYLQPHVTAWMTFGSLFLILAAMLLGAAVAAATFQTSMVQHLSTLGFLLLFSGGYLLLDTITVSFLYETQVFITYTRQICMMMAVYWMGLGIRDRLTGPRHGIAKTVLGISFALNAVLIPQYGATGAAWATVAAEVAVCLYQTAKTYTQQPYGRYLKDSMPFMLSAAVMGAAVYLLRGVVSETVPGMALLVLSGVAVYLLLFAVSLKLTGKSLKDSMLLK